MADDLDSNSRLIDCLPDGYICLGWAVSFKALNNNGDVVLINRIADVTHWEAVGMATSLSDDLRHDLTNANVEMDGD